MKHSTLGQPLIFVRIPLASCLTRLYNRRQTEKIMAKVSILLLLIVVSPLLTIGQSKLPSASDRLPTVTTPGKTNPETVSDINAQLIWLLGASPAPHDSAMETAARSAYWREAFGNLSFQDQEKLSATLRDFRSHHDAFAAEYNGLVPSISRDDVWKEYRDFRVKVNDLVAETVRTLNDLFPDSAAQFHSTVEVGKSFMFLSSYRSSADPDYATSSRAAATGFTFIQGAVSGGPFATGVTVGMVPGCPGKMIPQIRVGTADDSLVMGPPTAPWEYVNFQVTKPIAEHQVKYSSMVNCFISKSQQPPAQ